MLDTDKELDQDTLVADDTEATKDELLTEAHDEADAETVITELSELDRDLTIEDLRRIPGTSELSDEQVLEMWRKLETGETAAPVAFSTDIPLYDDKGNKITDFSKLTLADVFSGKVQLGYTALGKEQRKALKDVLRNSALGHYNEQQMGTLRAERQRALEQHQQAQQQLETWGHERKLMEYALSQYLGGNAEPLKQLITSFQRAVAQGPLEQPAATDAGASSQAGMQYWYEEVVPRVDALADKYKIDKAQLRQYALELIEAEPAQFFTQQKLENILAYELPRAIEEAQGNGATPAASAEVEALKKQVQELMAKVENSSTEKLRQGKKSPPAGGGTPASAGESIPELKTRDDMRRWLRG